jgi:hypothetical protein
MHQNCNTAIFFQFFKESKMSFNPGYMGTGAYKTNASSLMQSSTTSAQNTKQSGGSSFAQALSNVTSPETVQHRQEAKSCLKNLAQCQQAGVDVAQLSQSLTGNTYASLGDYLNTLSQTATQSLTATA